MIALKVSIFIFIALLYFTGIASARIDEKITDVNITDVNVTDVNNAGNYNISVALDHIFISMKNKSLKI